MRLLSAIALLLLWTAVPTAVAAPNEEADADVQALQQAGLSADDAALLRYFREATPEGVDHTTITNLIVQLGDDEFTVREQATARLVKLGAVAAPLLRRAPRSDAVEVAPRAGKIPAQIGKGRNVLVPAPAATLPAPRRPAPAAEALRGFLPFAANDSVAEEVRTTLAAVALVKGEPDKALTAALADKWAVKRAAAAEALIRAGGAGQRGDLRRLLRDQDLRVRLP